MYTIFRNTVKFLESFVTPINYLVYFWLYSVILIVYGWLWNCMVQ